MPDGRSVVVVDANAPGGNTLYRISLESGDSTALTDPAQVLPGCRVSRPTAKVVAFAGKLNEGRNTTRRKNQIWLMPIGGGKPVQVSAGQGRQPDWSPTDTGWHSLPVVVTPQDITPFFIIDRKGGNLTQLTGYSVNAQHPVWSPDGKWLVFSAQVDEQGNVFGLRASTSRSCRDEMSGTSP
jgi:Tol biopolymer transport system component